MPMMTLAEKVAVMQSQLAEALGENELIEFIEDQSVELSRLLDEVGRYIHKIEGDK
jgi:hypothetical protein